MSGLGKGVVASSISKLLQLSNQKVSCVKIDPYLNFDAGTMNPIAHGEVFVTEDGGECDMDIGNYERYLNQNIPKSHNITTAQIYSSVIEAERKGEYLEYRIYRDRHDGETHGEEFNRCWPRHGSPRYKPCYIQ